MSKQIYATPGSNRVLALLTHRSGPCRRIVEHLDRQNLGEVLRDEGVRSRLAQAVYDELKELPSSAAERVVVREHVGCDHAVQLSALRESVWVLAGELATANGSRAAVSA